MARHNTTFHVGPDLTLNLRPFGPQVWLDTQVLFNRESNPTGFDEGFQWWGGFSQLSWKPWSSLITYGRYDWLHGSRFDDTPVGGVTGPVKPREWAAVVGVQWYTLLNLRLIVEYSHHAFRNPASSPSHQEVDGDTVTLRIAGAL